MKTLALKTLSCAALTLAALMIFQPSPAYAQASQSDNKPAATVAEHLLHGHIHIAGQIRPEALAQLKASGIQTIIDMRPDGEASDQPPSVQMQAAAQAIGLQFAYIPIAHGAIQDNTVSALQAALANQPGPVLLYCRSGSRVARAWGLAEASQPGGLDVTAILSAVKASGQQADDLEVAIKQRVAARAAVVKP